MTTLARETSSPHQHLDDDDLPNPPPASALELSSNTNNDRQDHGNDDNGPVVPLQTYGTATSPKTLSLPPIQSPVSELTNSITRRPIVANENQNPLNPIGETSSIFYVLIIKSLLKGDIALPVKGLTVDSVSATQERTSHILEGSTALIKDLDALAEIYPFIKGESLDSLVIPNYLLILLKNQILL